MKEVEVMTIGGKDYLIMKEVVDQGVSYVFLSGINDPEDVMIRKSLPDDPDHYIALENEEEYHLATLLLFKEMKKED